MIAAVNWLFLILGLFLLLSALYVMGAATGDQKRLERWCVFYTGWLLLILGWIGINA